MKKILVIDLDNTLVKSDLFIMSSFLLLKKNIFYFFIMLFWFTKGLSYLKYRVSLIIDIPVQKIVYNKQVISYILQRKKLNHTIVLATASTKKYAKQIADFLGFFDEVLSSSTDHNLSSYNKAKYLAKLYGKYEFDYAGDHKRDIPVWLTSNIAILVNISYKSYITKKLLSHNKKIHHINDI